MHKFFLLEIIITLIFVINLGEAQSMTGNTTIITNNSSRVIKIIYSLLDDYDYPPTEETTTKTSTTTTRKPTITTSTKSTIDNKLLQVILKFLFGNQSNQTNQNKMKRETENSSSIQDCTKDLYKCNRTALNQYFLNLLLETFAEVVNDSPPAFQNLTTIVINQIYNITKTNSGISFSALVTFIFSDKAPILSNIDSANSLDVNSFKEKVFKAACLIDPKVTSAILNPRYIDAGTSVTTCDNSLKIDCSMGTIKIISANFGKSDPNVCSSNDDNAVYLSLNTFCSESMHTKLIVSKKCNGLKSCDIAMNDGFPDRCPCQPFRYLEIEYICLDLSPKRFPFQKKIGLF